jgi:hypothetical protein
VWLEEAIAYKDWYAEQKGESRFSDWRVSRRIGIRAVAAYYECLKEQYIKRHHDWTAENYQWDYSTANPHDKRRNIYYKIHCAPADENRPNFGSGYKIKVKKPKTEDGDKQLIYIMLSYCVPHVDIIGWYSSEEIKHNCTFYPLSEKELHPMYTCPGLCDNDKKLSYK